MLRDPGVKGPAGPSRHGFAIWPHPREIAELVRERPWTAADAFDEAFRRLQERSPAK
jgi:hypothetical protein